MSARIRWTNYFIFGFFIFIFIEIIFSYSLIFELCTTLKFLRDSVYVRLNIRNDGDYVNNCRSGFRMELDGFNRKFVLDCFDRVSLVFDLTYESFHRVSHRTYLSPAVMKLFSIIVYYKNSSGEVRYLKGAFDLNSFGFFQRSSVKEFMIFTGKVILERSALSSRSSTKEQDYMCHVYARADGLSGMVVADTEYPQRVAFNLLSRVLDEFASKVPAATWPTAVESNIQFNSLDPYLQKYQNPKDADAMMRVQEELDETKIILHGTIQSVLERGEKLDDLVAKSEGLSAQSRMFYTSARKMNKCCSWV